MPESNAPIIAIGELLWDLLPTGKALGGATANFAYRLRSLGDPILLVSRLGNDALGREARETLNGLDVPLSPIQTDPVYPTGTVPVTLDSSGSPHFVITEGVAFDHIELTPDIQEAAANAPLICFGTLAQRSSVTRDTIYRLLESAPQAVKLLDINLRERCYSVETVNGSLERADILKLNDAEVIRVGELLEIPADDYDHFTQALFACYPLTLCLITLGPNGVRAFSRDGDRAAIPGRKVTVVDTIGSGDAFTAGFVHEYRKGSPLARCCEFGNALGAAVATVKGGMSPVPLPD